MVFLLFLFLLVLCNSYSLHKFTSLGLGVFVAVIVAVLVGVFVDVAVGVALVMLLTAISSILILFELPEILRISNRTGFLAPIVNVTVVSDCELLVIVFPNFCHVVPLLNDPHNSQVLLASVP